jgi:thiol-disulfide isomerase/thioredoxin
MNRADRRRSAPGKAKTQPKGRAWIIYGSIALVLIGIVVAVAISSSTPPPLPAPQPVSLKIGDPAPEFQVSTDAGPFDLAAAKGKPVFLEVFATWCPHCQRETVILNHVYDAYKDRVSFVAVSGHPLGMDRTSPETQADVMNFVQQFSVRYPVAFDANLDVARKYFQQGYPSIIIIGKNGTIKTVLSGEAPEKQLISSLDRALAASS